MNTSVRIFLSCALIALGLFYATLHSPFVSAQKSSGAAPIEQRIARLERQIAEMQKQISALTKNQKNSESAAAKTQKNASQDDLITNAVARVTPAVVSIVISKDVPKLEIVYKDPFGDDPFFGKSKIRIPVYQQKGTEKKQVGAGTGFIATADGYVITNRHVVTDENAEYTVLLTNGTQKQGKVYYRDPDNDLAILKIDGGPFKSVTLGNSDTIRLGQTALAIGNALGEYNNSVSIGIVSGLKRKIEAANASGTREELNDIIQTDAAINPGNSGGPLIDTSGAVIGINVAMVQGSQSIGFSIPINKVRDVIGIVLGR